MIVKLRLQYDSREGQLATADTLLRFSPHRYMLNIRNVRALQKPPVTLLLPPVFTEFSAGATKTENGHVIMQKIAIWHKIHVINFKAEML